MIEIILFIAGIVLLIKGNVKATSVSEVSKPAGRVLGLILSAPFVINFLIGYSGALSDATRTNIQYVEYATIVLALIIVLSFFRKPVNTF